MSDDQQVAGNGGNRQAPLSAWHWVGYSLIVLVLLILAGNGAWFISSNHISDPKIFIAITLTSLFVLATTTTLAMIFLWGAGVLKFTETFVNWLGGATVAEVAGILTIIVNFYFSSQPPKPQAPPPAPAVQQMQAAPTPPPPVSTAQPAAVPAPHSATTAP